MAARLLPRIGLGVAGLLLAALAVSVNLGLQKLDDLDTPGALALMPWGAAANAAAAEDALRASQYAEAERLSVRSLDRTLLNVKALRTLALAREARDAEDRMVLPAMLLAGQLGWRDTPTQYWLMITGLRAGVYPVALQRADALLRRDQNMGEVFSILRLAATDPAVRKVIVETLVTRPDWRLALFQARSTSAGEADGMEAIVRALQKTAAPPTRRELWYYLDGLVRTRDYDRAYRIWSVSLNDRETGWPHDPVFTKAAAVAAESADQMPFEWTFRTEQGDAPRFGPQGGITLDGNYERIADFVAQTIHLPPGPHRLLVDISGRRDQLNVLQWKVACLPMRKQLLGSPTVAAAGKTFVTGFDFVIPPQDCAYQRLSLTISPPVESGNISMTINKVSITG